MMKINSTRLMIKLIVSVLVVIFIYQSRYSFKLFPSVLLSSSSRNNFETFKDKLCNFKYVDAAFDGRYDLRIIIITYNRPESLLRLINSLNNAFYQDANVALEVWIDRSKEQIIHNATVEALKSVRFSKGICDVFIHPEHVGIRGQWLSTLDLDPNSSEIAVIFEDDLTVSPHFYTYLKLVHNKYGPREDIAGFSLQGKSIRHTDGQCCLNVSNSHLVFLYPTLGTSGFSPNPRQWVQFKSWLHYNLIGNLKVPLIKGHISSVWYTELSKKGNGDSMWEMEYLFYTHDRKQYILYPNFPGHKGLTYNWFEAGLHFKEGDVKTMMDEHRNILIAWNITSTEFPDDPVSVDNGGHIIRGGEKQNNE